MEEKEGTEEKICLKRKRCLEGSYSIYKVSMGRF